MGWISRHARGLRDEGRSLQPVLLTPVETLRRWYTYWSQRVCISCLWFVSISWRRSESEPRWGLLLPTRGTRRYRFKPLLGKRGGRISDVTYINHEVFSSVPCGKSFFFPCSFKETFFPLVFIACTFTPDLLALRVSDTTLCLPQNRAVPLKCAEYQAAWVCFVKMKAL